MRGCGSCAGCWGGTRSWTPSLQRGHLLARSSSALTSEEVGAGSCAPKGSVERGKKPPEKSLRIGLEWEAQQAVEMFTPQKGPGAPLWGLLLDS